MGKPVKGTVATVNDDGALVTDCEKVLEFYVNWGDCPKHWSDMRAAELATACREALRAMRRKPTPPESAGPR